MKNEITKVIKIVLLFISMAIMNLMLLGILAMLGFSLTGSVSSYLVLPLFSTLMLLFINKMITRLDRQKEK
ncbi:hypothetical protein D2908_07750 [Streptococcus sp. LQJ-218]|nr:hypothetical protein D2908_07750 [Streptococcus sp. LQJ-218]